MPNESCGICWSKPFFCVSKTQQAIIRDQWRHLQMMKSDWIAREMWKQNFQSEVERGSGGDGVATCENIGGKWNFSWQYFQSKQFYFFAWNWSGRRLWRKDLEFVADFVVFAAQLFSSFLFIDKPLLKYFWGFREKGEGDLLE